jgi:hypothetical protein
VKRSEVKIKQENGQTCFFFSFLGQKYIFKAYNNKTAHSFLSAWSFLLVHIQFTPNEGTQRLWKLSFLRNPTMEVGL